MSIEQNKKDRELFEMCVGEGIGPRFLRLVLDHYTDEQKKTIVPEMMTHQEALEFSKVKMPWGQYKDCLLYTSPSPRDQRGSRMPSSA